MMGNSWIASIVDATDDIARQSIRSRGLLFFPMLPWVLVMIHRSWWTITIAASLSLPILGFVLWRFWVVLVEEAQASDQEYDEEGKFKLSAEYHDTESATAARRHPPKP